MKLITETHAEHIRGTLSCYDRIVIQGTLHPFCYKEGMTSFLKSRQIRIFDYKEFAKGLRDTIIKNKVEHRNGTFSAKVAHMKKGIYGLSPLQNILSLANRRYIEFISTIEDKSVGINNLNKISKNVKEKNRTYKGFNFFSDDDQQIFLTIARGEFNIRGFQNKDLRLRLQKKTTSSVCRIIKRLRTHGLIKKITRSYKYYLTVFGRKVITTGLKLKELFIIPELTTQI